jgi:hypothetical protein
MCGNVGAAVSGEWCACGRRRTEECAVQLEWYLGWVEVVGILRHRVLMGSVLGLKGHAFDLTKGGDTSSMDGSSVQFAS